MPENDLLKRMLDAGVAFTQMTQKRAEEIVNELVRTGEMRAEQAQTMVQDLVDKSRQNTERIIDSVRKDIREQVSGLGLATKAEVDALRAELASLRAPARPAATAAPRKAAPKKAAAKAPAGPAKRPAKTPAGPAKRAAKTPAGPAKRAAKTPAGPAKRAAKKA